MGKFWKTLLKTLNTPKIALISIVFEEKNAKIVWSASQGHFENGLPNVGLLTWQMAKNTPQCVLPFIKTQPMDTRFRGFGFQPPSEQVLIWALPKVCKKKRVS